MPKVFDSAKAALAERLFDGATIAVGGFGLSGNPFDIIEAVRDSGVKDLTIVSNNMGVDGKGLGILLENQQVKKVIASYVGENKLFAQQYLDGSIEVEFAPQGTLAERMRAGGAGIAGFYTKTGVGTPVAEGKEHKEFDGQAYILERGIIADFGLVRAWKADQAGNLLYRYTSRNFNPLVAQCGRYTVVEAEEISPEFIDPNAVMTPGIFVQGLVLASGRAKEIEQRTLRSRAEGAN